ncbi:uncharacterized protein LOC115581177 isoform X1 [Sparus aurata]|uniref:uncharacterized protein LOC115581177 isoform X1 n=1 Tax=Sparus aurata TaxID=8175 RepID=UPI0011C0F7CF|nr:uncharacterized protein LOC115581177 isoform X1 [Sparus aurata]
MEFIEDFVQTPSEELLNCYKKDQLLKLADFYKVELPKKLSKEELLKTLKDKLAESGILSGLGDGAPVSVTDSADKASPVVSRSVPSVAGYGVGLTFEQQKQLLLLQLQHEQKNVLEVEKLRQEARLREVELAHVQANKQMELQRYKFELMSAGKLQPESSTAGVAVSHVLPTHSFDVTVNLRLVPKFNDQDPDIFFVLFERLAEARHWSDAERTLLLQCVLTGKAQEAYSALSVTDSVKYELVKTAVLRAYELVPEAYRQRFRQFRRGRQTHSEFSRDLVNHFNRWCAASQVETLVDLQELILLEQFKNTLSDRVVTYLNEQKVTTISDAAKLADEFVLTHKCFTGENRGQGNHTYRENMASAHTSKWLSDRTDRFVSKVGQGLQAKLDPNRVCNYCFGKGHWRNECPVLKKKWKSGAFATKPCGAAATLCADERSRAIAAVQTITKPSEGPVIELPEVETQLSDSTVSAEIDPGYAAFVSDGFVSLIGSDGKVPVKILRDSGALDSFIVGSVLPFSPDSAVGSSVEVRGMGLTVFSAPQHRLTLISDLLQGDVVMGVRPSLPMGGVQVILGNDLVGDRVWSDVPARSVEPASQVVRRESLTATSTILPTCAVTRAMSSVSSGSAVENFDRKRKPVFPVPAYHLPVSCSDLIQEQKDDPTLQVLFCQVLPDHEVESAACGYFLQDGILVRKWVPHGECFVGDEIVQVVLPLKRRPTVLQIAHDGVSGHLGVRKTYDRVLRHFYWPRLKKDISAFIKTCHTCQLTGKPNQVIKPAPLYPIPVAEHPFEHLIVDCVGPLPRSKSGSNFLLTVMCQATRYPAAFPLRNITTKSVVKALTQFMSTFGIPKVIQSDQGSNFTSKLFAEVLQQLNIRHSQSSAYQSQGALERFHQTLKSLLRAYCTELDRDWEEGLPWLMLSAREVSQESLGFSPNDLVFGHTVRGFLASLQSDWKSKEAPQNLIDYVNGFRHRLYQANKLAKENLKAVQHKMKRLHDRRAESREFSPGDQVLALLPLVGSPFQAKFCGPYMVAKKVSDLNYLISTPDRKKSVQLCHVNLLKPYFARSSVAGLESSPSCVAVAVPVGQVRVHSDLAVETEEELCTPDDGMLRGRLKNSESLASLNEMLTHLSEPRRSELVKLVKSYPCLFADTPSRTHLIEHDIDVGEAPPVRQRFYRMSPVKHEHLEAEVKYMLENNIAEPCASSWSSPCLLVKKSDGTFRPCTDLRKVNKLTKPDSFPLPRMEDCVDQVGSAKFVSKFDLLKGYWQVPLTPRAREIASFITPSGLYSYTVMPFGLRNAPATFQRLMNKVVSGLVGCAVYLDDVVVYSDTWEDHLQRIQALFDRLALASLTVNLAKCEFAKATVTYLGKVVGHGQVRPVRAKVSAVDKFPVPATKKDLSRFLGMVGYYRGFCKNFSTVVAPLTSLLSPKVKFEWSRICQEAFESVKSMLCSAPVLAAPQMEKPFSLYVDASKVGAGAVLMQTNDHGVDCPVPWLLSWCPLWTGCDVLQVVQTFGVSFGIG